MLSDQDNNKVNEPAGAYQPPLTFEKVWLMFQETKSRIRETDDQIRERFRETDKQFKETDRRFRKTEELVKRLSKHLGGLGMNAGEVAEDYFRGALENMTELAGIPIKQVESFRRKRGKLEGQYDVVLVSNNTVVVVEVKHKLHSTDVLRFHDLKLPVFKVLYPEYAEHKVIGAVAGMAIAEDATEKAMEIGFLLLTQTGQKIQVLNPKGFEPKVF